MQRELECIGIYAIARACLAHRRELDGTLLKRSARFDVIMREDLTEWATALS